MVLSVRSRVCVCSCVCVCVFMCVCVCACVYVKQHQSNLCLSGWELSGGRLEWYSYGIRLKHTVTQCNGLAGGVFVWDKTTTHCHTLQHNVTGWPEGYPPPCVLMLTWHYYVVQAHLKHHYVTEDSNQHNYTVERHNNITIPLNRHNTLTFPRNNSSFWRGNIRSDPSFSTRTGTVLVGGTKTHLGGTGMRHSTARGSVPVFRTLSQRGPFKYSEKLSGETVVTQERWGRSHPWKQRCGNIHIHTHHIHFTQRVPPAGVTQYDFVQERQVAEGWE